MQLFSGRANNNFIICAGDELDEGLPGPSSVLGTLLHPWLGATTGLSTLKILV